AFAAQPGALGNRTHTTRLSDISDCGEKYVCIFVLRNADASRTGFQHKGQTPVLLLCRSSSPPLAGPHLSRQGRSREGKANASQRRKTRSQVPHHGAGGTRWRSVISIAVRLSY